jgi:hypothetical protein
MALLLHLGLWVIEKSAILMWRSSWWTVKRIRGKPERDLESKLQKEVEELSQKIAQQQQEISSLTLKLEASKPITQ